MKKSIFKSKTFWFNVLSIAATVTGVLPLGAEVSTVVVGCLNIALRAITKDPVSIVSQ